MRPLSVIIAHHDPQKASHLATGLSSHFRSVHTAGSMAELHEAIRSHRAEVVVIDLEFVRLEEVEQLHFEYGRTMFICTHRVPDERMWSEALEAGAMDVCHDADIRGIVVATYRHPCTASPQAVAASSAA